MKNRQWADANAERVKAYKAEWYQANKERVTAAAAVRAVEKAEEIKATRRAYYQKNKAEILEKQRRYASATPARREAGLARLKAWALADPKRLLERDARRRARKRANGVEKVNYAEVLRSSGGVCGICGKPLDLFGTDIDHITPIAKGGAHVLANLQATHARCNRSKGARLVA